MRGVKVEDPTERAMRRAYISQRGRAIGRGIAFEFTFETWRHWWLTDNRWSHRGKRKNFLVMARRGDSGPYNPENVYCTTNRGNCCDVPYKKRCAAAQKAWDDPERMSPLKVRGAKHPRSRPVKTQRGIFGSAALAAEAFEISRQWAASMAREKREGWEYL